MHGCNAHQQRVQQLRRNQLVFRRLRQSQPLHKLINLETTTRANDQTLPTTMWPWDSAQRWGGPVQPFNGRAKLCTQRKQTT